MKYLDSLAITGRVIMNFLLSVTLVTLYFQCTSHNPSQGVILVSIIVSLIIGALNCIALLRDRKKARLIIARAITTLVVPVVSMGLLLIIIRLLCW